MKVIRRHTPCGDKELRLEEREGQLPKIHGYAAVFYDGTQATEYRYYDVIERILPGAFNFALPKSDVRGLFNHDSNNVLGRNKSGTLALSIDGRGLAYVIDTPKTSLGESVAESIRRRDVTGSSFAFTVGKRGQTWTRGDDGLYIREFVSVEELFDVGPVTYPAYTGTEAQLRSLGIEPEDLTEYKREADAAGKGGDDPAVAAALQAGHVRAAELRKLALSRHA